MGGQCDDIFLGERNGDFRLPTHEPIEDESVEALHVRFSVWGLEEMADMVDNLVCADTQVVFQLGKEALHLTLIYVAEATDEISLHTEDALCYVLDIGLWYLAFAAKFSAAGMTVEDDIIAVTNVAHTDASDVARLSRRMRFEGNVTQGASYIILDDFITSGAELRDMRDYISSKGGNVVMITTFGHGSFGRLTDIRIDNDYKNKLKEAGITDQDLRKYGIASEIGCLTISEAAKLSRVVNASAKRRTSQIIERFSDTRQEQSTVSTMAGEIPISERREQTVIMPAVSTNTYLRR